MQMPLFIEISGLCHQLMNTQVFCAYSECVFSHTTKGRTLIGLINQRKNTSRFFPQTRKSRPWTSRDFFLPAIKTCLCKLEISSHHRNNNARPDFCSESNPGAPDIQVASVFTGIFLPVESVHWNEVHICCQHNYFVTSPWNCDIETHRQTDTAHSIKR